MKSKKKICFLTSTLNYGGATKILVEVANYLSKYYQIDIVNYGEKKSFYRCSSDINIISAPYTKCKIPKIRLIAQMLVIRKFFKDRKYDAIVAFGNTEKLHALAATIGKKTKVIISERQDPYNYNPGKKHTMWARYILADGCIFQTEGARQYFPKSVRNKSAVIPNFVDIEDKEFKSISTRKKEIAFSARFELKQKRQDLMIEAMRIIVKSHSDWKLVFYGDGPDMDCIKELVSLYSLENNVVFMGCVSGVNERIYNSGMLVLTSDYEGIPNVVIEAMAMGIPVVSTDCSPGGSRLLIKTGVNGIIVPTGDIDAIANAINTVIENPEIADSFGKEAKKVLNNYSPEIILPMWKHYFNKVIGD